MIQTQSDLLDQIDANASEQSGPNPIDAVVHAMGRYSAPIALLTAIGVAGGFVAGAIKPNEYVSSAKILVRLGFREQMTAESTLDENMRIYSAFSMEDEIHLLTNPELYERIARKVGPRKILAPPDPTAKDTPATPYLARKLHEFQSWWFSRSAPPFTSEVPESPLMIEAAAAKIAQSAEIISNRRASTLGVAYKAQSPELAQQVAQTYVEVILERHNEVFVGEHRRNFVEEQTNLAVKEAEAARSAYANRLLEAGVFDFPTQRASLVSEAQKLEADRHQDEIRLGTIESELATLAKQQEETAPQLDQALPDTTIPNPEHSSLSGQLEVLMEELSALGRTYSEKSAFYRTERDRLEPKIDSIRTALADTEPFLRTESAPYAVSNPAYESLVEQRRVLELEADGLRVAQELRRSTLEEVNARLVTFAALEIELSDLELEMNRADAHAQQMLESHSRAEIMGLLERSEHMSNLMVTQEATLPRGKIGPSRGKILGIGAFAGLLLGIGLAVLRVLTDPTVRYPETLERNLGVRVLGVIRNERRWARVGKKLRRQVAR